MSADHVAVEIVSRMRQSLDWLADCIAEERPDLTIGREPPTSDDPSASISVWSFPRTQRYSDLDAEVSAVSDSQDRLRVLLEVEDGDGRNSVVSRTWERSSDWTEQDVDEAASEAQQELERALPATPMR